MPTSLLKDVLLATVPPVKLELPPDPTAEPFHVRVPFSFVSAISPMYRSLVTLKSFRAVMVPVVLPNIRFPVLKLPTIKFSPSFPTIKLLLSESVSILAVLTCPRIIFPVELLAVSIIVPIKMLFLPNSCIQAARLPITTFELPPLTSFPALYPINILPPPSTFPAPASLPTATLS